MQSKLQEWNDLFTLKSVHQWPLLKYKISNFILRRDEQKGEILTLRMVNFNISAQRTKIYTEE